MIGAKRKLDLNGRGRVGAMDKSFMQEVLLLFVAVFQPNRPKVPICPETVHVAASTSSCRECRLLGTDQPTGGVQSGRTLESER